ncbi:MAG TPA: fibronectin type III domain-containing protein [Frankiaceae bacterium]|nr:fibronectin type III domain-containing protein [Frankiaceae bacterium]
MKLTRTLAAVASTIVLPVLGPVAAVGSTPPTPTVPVAGAVAAPDAYAAIPVLRHSDRGPAPFLYVIRPAGFGLTVADLQAAGLTVVPETVSVWNVADRAVDIDVVAHRIAGLVGAKQSAAGASSTDAESASVNALAALSDVPIAVYSDTSNTAVGHSIASTAWSDARSILSSDAGVTFNVVIQQDNATAYPPGAPAVTDVTTECDLQRFSQYEESIARPVRAQAVLVFSDSTIRPFGVTTDHYGLAMGKPPYESLDVSTRWNRGSSRDACTSTPGGTEYRRSPAFIPAAFASTAAWNLGAGTEKQAPSHWAAHEVAHMFTMTHDMAECTWMTIRMHKTLEAASSDQRGNCAEASNAQTYQLYRFSERGKTAIRAENTRRNDCVAAGWCTSNATPSAPRSISAQPEDGAVTLNWVAPQFDGGSAVTGYCIFRNSSDNFEEGPATEQRCTGSTPSYRWDGLTNGQTSYFYVRAYNSNDDPSTPWGSTPYDRDGPRSDYIAVAPGTVPGAPTLNAITPGNRQLTLSWTPNPNDGGYPVISYRVYRTCSVCTPTTFNTSSTTWTDTNLTNGQVYYYKVAALNVRGEGAQSNERWDYPRTAPGAPTLNTATSGNAEVSLSWTAPSSDGGSAISGYKVYRATSSTGTRVQLTTGGCGGTVLTTSCTDNTVTNGTTYWYDVRAVNNAGTSGSSNVLSAQPAAPVSGAFSETWESGTGAWAISGTSATQDCVSTPVLSGCSLKFQPTSSSGLSVTRSASVTMASPSTASFWFRGSATTGDTDASVQFTFNTGGSLTLSLTEGVSSNNGVNLIGPSNSTGAFYNWPSANTWYQAVVTINPSTDVATVQVKNTSGTVVGSSSTNVAIPSAATSITGVGIQGNAWNGTQNAFNVDSISIT